MKNKVFICHTSKDHDFVLKLAEKLKSDGINVWIDDWEMNVGDSIVGKVNEGLSESDFLLAVISENSINSVWVQKELNSTLMRQLSKNDIITLPVLLDFDPNNLPPLLKDIYGARFSKLEINEEEYQKLIKPIVEKRQASAIRKFQDTFFDNVEQIDQIVSKRKPTQQQLLFIFDLIKDPTYGNYFFKKVENPIWFFPLKEAGYFDSNQLPGPTTFKNSNTIYTPDWNVLPYLEKISEQVHVPGNDIYIDELFQIIISVTEFKQNNPDVEINDWTWLSFVKILLNLPNEKIPVKVIELIKIWLNKRHQHSLTNHEVLKLLSKFLPDHPTQDDILKAETIIDIITGIIWIKKENLPLPQEYERFFKKEKEEAQLLIDYYWLQESFQTNSQKIAEKCSNKPVFIIANRLIEIFKKQYNEPDRFNDYSFSWFKSLHHGPDLSLTQPEEILSLILRDLIINKAGIDQISTRKICEEFLTENYPYPIFTRFVLYVIGKYWQDYNDIFWSVLESGEGMTIFEVYDFEPELYILLQNNVKYFSKPKKERIKRIIEKGTSKYQSSENPKDQLNLWKQRWFSALKADPYFAKDYAHYKNITGIEEKISFKAFETKSGFGPSPITVEQILKTSNNDLSKLLQEFRTRNSWEGPSLEGLSFALQQAVCENPSKFTEDLNPFLDITYLHIHEMLNGFINAWKNHSNIDWDKIFDFILQYIGSEKFVKDQLYVENEWGAKHQWIIARIGELIREGTQNDDNAFSPNLIPKSLEVIFKAIDQCETDNQGIMNDPLTHTLNSAIGKIYFALFQVALRIARIEQEKETEATVKWSENIKEKFEQGLNGNVLEVYVLLGQYIPNFYYLDKEWVKDKIRVLSKTKDEGIWYPFMTGYLFCLVYKDIYYDMRPHYSSAIEYPFQDRYSPEGLIRHLFIGYVNNFESFSKSSLFYKLLENWNYDQMAKVVGFFWREEESFTALRRVEANSEDIRKKNENLMNKVKDFWRYVYEKCLAKKELTNLEERILSETAKLAVFLPEIDEENYQWLKLSAKYASLTYNTPHLVKYLNYLKDQGDKKRSVRYVGEIFLEMLTSYVPDYDKKHILSIVESLYESKDETNIEMANKICDIYGRNITDPFLREIYFRYN